jgi:hypothetical protein
MKDGEAGPTWRHTEEGVFFRLMGLSCALEGH